MLLTDGGMEHGTEQLHAADGCAATPGRAQALYITEALQDEPCDIWVEACTRQGRFELAAIHALFFRLGAESLERLERGHRGARHPRCPWSVGRSSAAPAADPAPATVTTLGGQQAGEASERPDSMNVILRLQRPGHVLQIDEEASEQRERILSRLYNVTLTHAALGALGRVVRGMRRGPVEIALKEQHVTAERRALHATELLEMMALGRAANEVPNRLALDE
jgi:hypothetical protein